MLGKVDDLLVLTTRLSITLSRLFSVRKGEQVSNAPILPLSDGIDRSPTVMMDINVLGLLPSWNIWPYRLQCLRSSS